MYAPGQASDSVIVVTIKRECYSIRINGCNNEIVPSDTDFIAYDNFVGSDAGIGENELVVQVRNVRLNGFSGARSCFVNNGFVRIVVSVSVHVQITLGSGRVGNAERADTFAAVVGHPVSEAVTFVVAATGTVAAACVRAGPQHTACKSKES
jgi:hypothetical protein